MALADPAMEIQNPLHMGSKPKPRDARQGRSNSQPQEIAPGEIQPKAQQLPLASQTFRDVDLWREVYKKRPGIRTAKAKEILAILSSFHTFSQEYTVELSKLLEITPRNWLDNAVDNALLDYWEPILRVTEHNRSPHYRTLLQKGYSKLDALQRNLEERLNFRFDVNIVLYFERIGRAKRYPFGNMYLIGIPLIDAYRDDWMAIPHELGHHTFWKARFSDVKKGSESEPGTNLLQNEINSAMQQLDLGKDDPARKVIQKILDDWTEEIFADVVGARIAGKEFVTAAWDRISRKAEKKEDLFASDGTHPILYLVPDIRTTAAEIPFEDHWTDLFGNIEFTQLVPNPSSDGRPPDPSIRIKDLRTAVQSYAKNITAKLKEIKLNELLDGPSSVEQLKAFIRSRQKKTILGTPPNSDERELLRSLLDPTIIEKSEDWFCSQGHKNNGKTEKCPRCGEYHYVWSFLPFV